MGCNYALLSELEELFIEKNLSDTFCFFFYFSPLSCHESVCKIFPGVVVAGPTWAPVGVKGVLGTLCHHFLHLFDPRSPEWAGRDLRDHPVPKPSAALGLLFLLGLLFILGLLFLLGLSLILGLLLSPFISRLRWVRPPEHRGFPSPHCPECELMLLESFSNPNNSIKLSGEGAKWWERKWMQEKGIKNPNPMIE